MEITNSEDAGVTIITLAGRLDTMGVSSIEMAFTAMAVPTGRPVVVDLSGVSFLASLGVRLFISTARALSGRDTEIILFGAGPAVTEIIEMTGLDEIVPVVATRAEAIARART